MAIASDFLGAAVTIDDDLLGTEITQDDLDASDEFLYGIARRLSILDADLTLPATRFAVRDLAVAVACQRRAGLKAGRQPFGEDDPYITKQKYYAGRMAALSADLDVYDLTGNETRIDANTPAMIRLVRG